MDSQYLVGGCCAHCTVPTSGRRIEIYLAEARNFLFGGLSSALVETIIFRLEDSKLPRWAKFSSFSRRMEFLLGKYQLSRRRSEIYPAELESYLLNRLGSTQVETNIFRPEDSILDAWENFSTSGQWMQFLLGMFQLSGWRIAIYLADSWSLLLKWHSSILVETIIYLPEDQILSA